MRKFVSLAKTRIITSVMEHDKLDIEKLNKSQMVLLTLFISFMTSIATGIVTVSLMEKAPPTITETVNRVVERTVERVVPSQAAAVAQPVTQTVLVRESELIPKAVETVSPSIIRLYSGEATSSVFLGLGVVLDGSGLIAVDASVVDDAKSLEVELSGSMRVSASVVSQNADTGVLYLAAATSTPQGKVEWRPAQLAVKPVLGQTAVLITGRSAAKLAQGLVTGVSRLGDQEGMPGSLLETDIAKDVIMPGSPMIDTSGSVLGLSTRVARASGGSGFVAAAYLAPQLEEAKEMKVGTQ
jgi:S1-C subfamily serine protease